MNDEEARKLAEAAFISTDLVTKKDLTIALKELEINLAWKIGTLTITSLLGATAIFSAIVNLSR